MNKYILSLVVLIFTIQGYSQDTGSNGESIFFQINDNVKNSKEEYFVEILSNWKTYLLSQNYLQREEGFWNDDVQLSDYVYVSILLELREIARRNESIQCTILGIIPVKKDYYLINSMFSQVDNKTNAVNLSHIISVYAKKVNGKFLFYSGTQYHKEIYENKKVGEVNYIIHPEHNFDLEEAKKMDAFNKEMATLFELEPIPFDYVVTNNSTDLSNLMGLNFFSYSFQPVQSGGMTDNYNKTIYAGNNSSYYPHEVVHLYTYIKASRRYHPWVDEGIAAYFGGSTGYTIEWHIQKLKSFLEDNPDYRLGTLTELQSNIPNGEYTTDFRYAIGGFLMGQIYEKEGMKGLFEALEAGRDEEDYFNLLNDKLGFQKEEMEDYLRKELKKIKPLNEVKLKDLKY